MFRVTAIDNAVTKLSENSFLLEVATSIDCSHVDLIIPDSFKKEMAYKIVSQKETKDYL